MLLSIQLALSFYSLERLEGGQQGIEGFFGNGPQVGTSTTLKRSRSSSPANIATRDISRKTTSHQTSKTNKKAKVQNEIIEILTDSDDDGEQDDSRWTCPKCRRVFTADAEVASGQSTKERLEAVKREHQDFHLAQDLHRQDRHEDRHVKPREKTATTTNTKRVRRPPPKPEGIKAFFTPFDDIRKKKG
jgi:DNA polymerase eta